MIDLLNSSCNIGQVRAKAARLSEKMAFFVFIPVVQRIEWEFPKLLIRVRFSAGLQFINILLLQFSQLIKQQHLKCFYLKILKILFVYLDSLLLSLKKDLYPNPLKN
jgi:hypothetical protein